MSPIKAVDTIIEEAMSRGEFTDLPGAGKPLDLTAYFNTPEELRLAYSILKNAGILPHEAELLNEIAALKDELAVCDDSTQRKKLLKSIEYRQLKFNILMDGRKGS